MYVQTWFFTTTTLLWMNLIGMARRGVIQLSSTTVMNELSKSYSLYTANLARQGGPACCNIDCEGWRNSRTRASGKVLFTKSVIRPKWVSLLVVWKQHTVLSRFRRLTPVEAWYTTPSLKELEKAWHRFTASKSNTLFMCWCFDVARTYNVGVFSNSWHVWAWCKSAWFIEKSYSLTTFDLCKVMVNQL